jgi:hypothetical protein
MAAPESTMKPPVRLLVVFALLAVPVPVFALGEEAFGNAPRVKQPQWADGVLAVVNMKSRVYLQWVNGNETFFYRGDAKALNEALRLFAEIKDGGKSIVLLPGSGETKTFQGKEVPYDWSLHVPGGIHRAISKETHPVLTVYVKAAKPGPLADPKAAGKWIADLDDPIFRNREAAEAALRKLGRPAKPVLRSALAGPISAEQKRRIESLLKDLSDVDVSELVIPKGATVIGADDLVKEYKKGLADTDTTRRALNVDRLAKLAAYDADVVPTLIKLVASANHEYVRRMAAYGLGTAGTLAKSALPALKASLDDPDQNVAAACKTAVNQIENAKPVPAADGKLTGAILDDIRELTKERKKK